MNKNLLFIHSGGFWKDYTFKKAKDLGYGVILVQKDYKGGNVHIDHIIAADVYEPQKAFGEISCCKKDIHGVVTFSELGVETAAFVGERLKLRANPFESAQNSRDKLRMRRRFEENGVPSVEAFSLVSSPDDVKSFSRRFGYPVILKPTKFGGAIGVVRINSEPDVERLFSFVKNETDKFCRMSDFPFAGTAVMIETMIDPSATEVNVDMIIHNGEPLVISVAEKPQDTTGPTFQENDYVMPAMIENHDMEKIKEISVRAVKSLGLKWGAAHLEAKVAKPPKPFCCQVLEAGARCGGDLEVLAVMASTGIDLSEVVMRQATGDFGDEDFEKLKIEANNCNPKAVAVQVLYAPKNGVIKNIRVPDKIRNNPQLLEMKFEYHPGNEISMHYSEYAGAVMVAAVSPAEALKLVNDFAASVEIGMA